MQTKQVYYVRRVYLKGDFLRIEQQFLHSHSDCKTRRPEGAVALTSWAGYERDRRKALEIYAANAQFAINIIPM